MAKKIILVHGLGGSAADTWGKFPDFLEQDSELNFGIVLYGYQSPHFLFQFWQRAPCLTNIANGLLTDIATRCDLAKDEIILAGHSLGGLVIKKMLIVMREKQISNNIKKVCFFDVPHDGSGYANLGRYLSFRNRQLKNLCRDSSELDDLNDQWVNSGLDFSLHIMSVVAANDDIVSSLSSKSIFRYGEVKTINGVDHRSLVKPDSPNATSYLVFKKFILDRNHESQLKRLESVDLFGYMCAQEKCVQQCKVDEKQFINILSLLSVLEFEANHIIEDLDGGKTRLRLEIAALTTGLANSSVMILCHSKYEAYIRILMEGNVSGDHLEK